MEEIMNRIEVLEKRVAALEGQGNRMKAGTIEILGIEDKNELTNIVEKIIEHMKKGGGRNGSR